MTAKNFVIQRDDEDHVVAPRLPLLPLRDVVVFPFMVTPLLVGRPASVAAVERAMEGDKVLCVAAQREAEVEEPERDDLYQVGTVIKVLQVIRTPDEALKILVEGLARVDVTDLETWRGPPLGHGAAARGAHRGGAAHRGPRALHQGPLQGLRAAQQAPA